jgi:hypothetical protein
LTLSRENRDHSAFFVFFPTNLGARIEAAVAFSSSSDGRGRYTVGARKWGLNRESSIVFTYPPGVFTNVALGDSGNKIAAVLIVPDPPARVVAMEVGSAVRTSSICAGELDREEEEEE